MNIQANENRVHVFFVVALMLALIPTEFSHALTTNFYAGAGDGFVREDTAGTYATVRNAAGDFADYTTTLAELRIRRAIGNYEGHGRAIFQFDTSGLDDDADIVSATVYLHADAANTYPDHSCGTPAEEVNLTTVDTSSDTTLTVSDYSLTNYGSTPLSATTTFATWDQDTYMPFVLNAAGIAALNKSGFSAFALRTGADIFGVDPGCGDYGYRIYGIDTSETTGTTQDSYIEIVTADTGTLTVRKAVNESVTSSTVLQDDNHLSVNLATNTEYIVEAFIVATSTSKQPGLKLAFDAPSGSDMLLGYLAHSGIVLAGGGIIEVAETATAEIDVDRDSSTVVRIMGTIKTGSTSDNLTLQWAQNTSDTDSVTVRAGSYIRVTDI